MSPQMMRERGIVLLHCNINVMRLHVPAIRRSRYNPAATAELPRPKVTHGSTVLPAPDHDHDRCSADALAHAEALCAKRGERLTPIRRHVLEVLLASHKPLGAYEIIDRAGGARRSGRRRSPSIARSISCATRPRAPHREPQRVHRLHQQPRHRRARGVPDLRALRRGRRGAVGGGGRPASRPPRRARRLHAESAGDRDHRRLRALPADVEAIPSGQTFGMRESNRRTLLLDAARGRGSLVVFICFCWGLNQVSGQARASRHPAADPVRDPLGRWRR